MLPKYGYYSTGILLTMPYLVTAYLLIYKIANLCYPDKTYPRFLIGKLCFQYEYASKCIIEKYCYEKNTGFICSLADDFGECGCSTK